MREYCLRLREVQESSGGLDSRADYCLARLKLPFSLRSLVFSCALCSLLPSFLSLSFKPSFIWLDARCSMLDSRFSILDSRIEDRRSIMANLKWLWQQSKLKQRVVPLVGLRSSVSYSALIAASSPSRPFKRATERNSLC